jgi:hypothetical protein
MDNICAICGDYLNVKLTHKLNCGTPEEPHEFHYECLLKTFNYNHNIEKDRNCPYCRKKIDYLPLVYGLKKVVPGIHCPYHDLKNKKEELKGYQIKCKHILTRGKRKHEMCGKNCQLGSEYCGVHLKSFKNSQFKFDSKQKCIVIKQKKNSHEAEEKALEVSQ